MHIWPDSRSKRMTNCTIVYNGKTFILNAEYFTEASLVFADYYEPGEVMNIQSDVPLEIFERDFLPAVQRGKVVITAENYEYLSMMAEEWGVESLTEICNTWQESPDFIFARLSQEFQSNPAEYKSLKSTILKDFDQYSGRDGFKSLHPKILADIIASLKPANHRTMFRCIIDMITGGKTGVSYLLNKLDMDELGYAEIEEAINTDGIDPVGAGPFLFSCAQIYCKDLEKIRKAEGAQIAKQREIAEKEREIAELEAKIKDEKSRHREVLAQLNALYEKYEPENYRPPEPHRSQSGGRGGKHRGRGGKRGGAVHRTRSYERSAFEYIAKD